MGSPWPCHALVREAAARRCYSLFFDSLIATALSSFLFLVMFLLVQWLLLHLSEFYVNVTYIVCNELFFYDNFKIRHRACAQACKGVLVMICEVTRAFASGDFL